MDFKRLLEEDLFGSSTTDTSSSSNQNQSLSSSSDNIFGSSTDTSSSTSLSSSSSGDLFGSSSSSSTTDTQQGKLELNDVGKVVTISEISEIVNDYVAITERMMDISPIFPELYDRLEQVQKYLYTVLQNFNLYKDKLNIIIGYYIEYLIEATKLFLSEIAKNSDEVDITKEEIRKYAIKLELLREKVSNQVKKEKKKVKEKEENKSQQQTSTTSSDNKKEEENKGTDKEEVKKGKKKKEEKENELF